MPTIPRLQKSTSSVRKSERQKLYQRTDYRKTVDWYKREHIWCEECLKDNIYTVGKDLHHIISPFQGGLPESEKLRLLYDQENWKLLCDYHHRKAHGTTSKEEDKEYENKKSMAKAIQDLT